MATHRLEFRASDAREANKWIKGINSLVSPLGFVSVPATAGGGPDLDFQFVGANKYVELRQGAPIALTQQALPVGSNHRRKWKKKDDSSDSGSEDDDETYMPASNLVNLPGGGWGKAAGAGNLGGAGGSSGKR